MSARRGWIVVAVACAALGAGLPLLLADDDPVCGRPAESARPLDLNNAADRAHLDSDLQQIREAALQFSDEVSKRPVVSDSIDAREGVRTARVRARAWCEVTLADDLAKVHALRTSDVRARLLGGNDAPPPDLPQADADRASGTASRSAVVSRP